MPIPVTCSCGHAVNAPSQYAGKRVKCPSCGNPLDIPAVEAGLHGLMDEAGISEHPKCPSCNADLKSPDAVICIECGYNLESGKQVKGIKKKQEGHAGVVDELLAKAEEALEDTAVKAEGGYGNKQQEWMLMAIMLAVAAGIIAGAVMFFNYMEDKYEEEKETQSRLVAPADAWWL